MNCLVILKLNEKVDMYLIYMIHVVSSFKFQVSSFKFQVSNFYYFARILISTEVNNKLLYSLFFISL